MKTSKETSSKRIKLDKKENHENFIHVQPGNILSMQKGDEFFNLF